jgi:hypothetical protein
MPINTKSSKTSKTVDSKTVDIVDRPSSEMKPSAVVTPPRKCTKEAARMPTKETNPGDNALIKKKKKVISEKMMEMPPKILKKGTFIHESADETIAFIRGLPDDFEEKKAFYKNKTIVEVGRVIWYEKKKDSSIITVFLLDIDDPSDMKWLAPLIRDEEDLDVKNWRMTLIRRLSIFDVPDKWICPKVGSNLEALHTTGHKLYLNGQAQFNCNFSKVQQGKNIFAVPLNLEMTENDNA